jgi:hypothetical protein
MRHAYFRRTIAATALTLAVVACGGPKGTYTDSSGSFVLTLKGGGQANFAIPNSESACTYAINGDQLTLNCKDAGGPVTLTMHDDGSISGKADGFMPVLRKK